MQTTPFLMRYRVKVQDGMLQEENGPVYDEHDQLNKDQEDNIVWSQRYKTPPTSCHTAGRVIPGGFTKSGKYKSSRYRPGKTDRRAGK